LRFAVEGILIVACFQPVKVLYGIFGNGLLATGGDTKFVLRANLAGTCGLGLPLAIFLGLFTNLGLYGVFLAKGIDEITKLVCFFWRYRTPAWYKESLEECAPGEAARGKGDEKVFHNSAEREHSACVIILLLPISLSTGSPK
jgi:Na+-driven multidrug efflux pump